MGPNGIVAGRLKTVVPLAAVAAVGVGVAAAPVPTALVAVGIGAAVLVRDRLRPFALSVLVMLSLCEIYVEIGGRTIRAEDVLIVLLVIRVFVPVIMGQRTLRASPVYAPLLAFMGAIVLSGFVAIIQPADGLDKTAAIANAARLILAYAVFVIVYNYDADPERKLSAIIDGVLLFGFISCGIAVLQILFHKGMLPFRLPSILTESQPGANVEHGREVFGLFIEQTGAHMFSFMLSLQALAAFCVGLRVRPVTRRAFWFIYCAVMVLILVRISVRVALFSFVAGCAAVFVVEHKTRFQRVASAIIVGYAALMVVRFFGTHQFENVWLDRIQVAIPLLSKQGIEWQVGTTMIGRFELWEAAVEMARDHPVLGVGFNMYGPLSGYRVFSEGLTHPHNGLLHILSEMGLIGMITFAWLAIIVVRETLRARREPDRTETARTVDSLLLGMLVWLAVANIPATTFLFPKETIFLCAFLGARFGTGGSGLRPVNSMDVVDG